MIALLVALVFLFGYTLGQPDTDPVTAWLVGVVTVVYYFILVTALHQLRTKLKAKK